MFQEIHSTGRGQSSLWSSSATSQQQWVPAGSQAAAWDALSSALCSRRRCCPAHFELGILAYVLDCYEGVPLGRMLRGGLPLLFLVGSLLCKLS